MVAHKRVVYVPSTPHFDSLSARSRTGDRSALVRSLIYSLGLSTHCHIASLRSATLWEISLAHSTHYIHLLRATSRRAERQLGLNYHSSSDEDDSSADEQDEQEQLDAGLTDDCPAFPGLWSLARLTVGGTVVATESLVKGDANVACWFNGGRHHATLESARGFCYLNDIVVACRRLLSASNISKVLYIDLDVHHGDGVETAFLHTSDVTTVSLHLAEPGFYPTTGYSLFPAKLISKHSAICIPLRRGIIDSQYIKLFKSISTLVQQNCQAHAIIVQCGVDGLAGDELGGFNLTGQAFVQCIRHVLQFRKPTLVLGGGGYIPENAARVWADVLECCIEENEKWIGADGFARTGRDVPMNDDYFTRYGPKYWRDVAQKRMNNENSDDELQKLIDRVEKGLKCE